MAVDDADGRRHRDGRTPWCHARDGHAAMAPSRAHGRRVPDRPARAPGDRWRLVARSLGELLVTVGVVLLLFVVYELWVTDLFNAQAQNKLDQSLHDRWSASAPLAPGTTDHGRSPSARRSRSCTSRAWGRTTTG